MQKHSDQILPADTKSQSAPLYKDWIGVSKGRSEDTQLREFCIVNRTIISRMDHMVQFTVPMTFWVTRSSQKRIQNLLFWVEWVKCEASCQSYLNKRKKKIIKKQVESGKLTIEYSPLVQLIKIKFWYFIGVYNNKYNITYGRLEIRKFSSCVDKYFPHLPIVQHLKGNFVSLRRHEIYSISVSGIANP